MHLRCVEAMFQAAGVLHVAHAPRQALRAPDQRGRGHMILFRQGFSAISTCSRTSKTI